MTINNIKLSHYSKNLIEKLDSSIIYDDEILYFYRKPNGLWISVDEKYGWKDWCIDAEFRLDRLSYKYEIVLKNDPNVLILTALEEIKEFSQKYFIKEKERNTSCSKFSGNGIDWALVKENYQGIIITAYGFKFWCDHPWLYGWDCASGCIWDLNCIQKFNFIEHKIY